MATTIDIRIRGDTAANWETKNPILKQRELGYDMTAKRLKVGDGLTAWKDLAYVAPDVINDLVTGGESVALSAEQGKVLKELIDAKGSEIEIVDKLTSSKTDAALSAKQGKVLKGLIDDKADSSDLTNINTSITKITTQMINKTDLTTETWRFTLEDNTTVDKKVALWS